MQLARVAGAHTGAFSEERIFVHKLSEPQPATSSSVKEVVAKSRLRKRFLKRILPALSLFVALLFQLLIRVQMVHAGYRVHDLRSKALEHDIELRELNAKIAVATTPKTLVARAHKELGLDVTPPQRVRSYSPGA